MSTSQESPESPGAHRPATTGLTVRRASIESLHLDPANARQHGPENLDAIIGSLKRFGQAEPLVVHKQTGRIIGGNGRLVAMKQLGWTHCDVVDADLDNIEAAVLGIALNRTSELASWDGPALAQILEQLRAENALVGVGYSEADIDELLEELGRDTGDNQAQIDDPGPGAIPPTATTSSPSKKWVMHRRSHGGRDQGAQDAAYWGIRQVLYNVEIGRQGPAGRCTVLRRAASPTWNG